MSKFKALVKNIKPSHVPIFFGVFGVCQWGLGYELIQYYLVITFFVITLLAIPFSWLFGRLLKRLSIGKKTISCDNQGKYIHRMPISLRLFIYGLSVFGVYHFLGALVERFQWQEQYTQLSFLFSYLAGISLIVVSLLNFAAASLLRIEYDDGNLVHWKFPLFRKNEHKWSNLIEINDNRNDEFVVLKFQRTGNVKIIGFYEAHDQIIEFAKSKLNNA